MDFTSDFVSNLFSIFDCLECRKKIIFNLSDAFSTKVSTEILFIAEPRKETFLNWTFQRKKNLNAMFQDRAHKLGLKEPLYNYSLLQDFCQHIKCHL